MYPVSTSQLLPHGIVAGANSKLLVILAVSDINYFHPTGISEESQKNETIPKKVHLSHKLMDTQKKPISRTTTSRGGATIDC